MRRSWRRPRCEGVVQIPVFYFSNPTAIFGRTPTFLIRGDGGAHYELDALL